MIGDVIGGQTNRFDEYAGRPSTSNCQGWRMMRGDNKAINDVLGTLMDKLRN